MTHARIVFDLDGTLIDSAPDIQVIANSLLEQESAAPISLAQTHSFIGNGVGVFVERMSALRGIPEDKQVQLTAEFIERYKTEFWHTLLYPEVENVLEHLGEQHSLAICTNKPIEPCHAILAHLRIDRYFGAVFGGDSLPTRKPDPAILHATFEALGSGPRIYVGDSEVDAKTAQAANTPFVFFTEGYRKSPVEEIPFDRSFEHFSELPAIISDMIDA